MLHSDEDAGNVKHIIYIDRIFRFQSAFGLNCRLQSNYVHLLRLSNKLYKKNAKDQDQWSIFTSIEFWSNSLNLSASCIQIIWFIEIFHVKWKQQKNAHKDENLIYFALFCFVHFFWFLGDNILPLLVFSNGCWNLFKTRTASLTSWPFFCCFLSTFVARVFNRLMAIRRFDEQ